MDDLNREIEIDIIEAKGTDTTAAQLPINFISIGMIDNDDVKVYINQHVYNFIEKFSSSDKGRELGGILVGDYVCELGKTHVVITGYIEAKYTDASSSTLTFTHETWDHVHREHALLYPDKKIIGWHHTHPSYGIFLSNYDLFIQQNFFNLPWQIAYVVDPVNKTRGFFQWKNEKVQKLNGFYIFDDVGRKISMHDEIKPHSGENSPQTDTKWGRPARIIISLLFICLIAINIGLMIKISRVNEAYAIAEAGKNELKDQYDGVNSKNNELLNQINQLEQIEENQGSTDNDNSIVFQKYIVQRGDTIALICKKLNIDYSTQIKIIKRVNGLGDINKIYSGQELLLPDPGTVNLH